MPARFTREVAKMIQTMDGRPRSPRHGFGIEENTVRSVSSCVAPKKNGAVLAPFRAMRESRLPPIPKCGESDFAIVETTRIQALLQLAVRSEAHVTRERRSIGSARRHAFAVGPGALRNGSARAERGDGHNRDGDATDGADECRIEHHDGLPIEVMLQDVAFRGPAQH